jgi:hypothetical protein
METRFGHDFGRVRVHTGARAAESAEAVGALAYTVGENVVFGPGRYAPGMGEGRRLLAHELTRVVQQGAAPAVVREAIPVRQAPLPGPTGRILQRNPDPRQSAAGPPGGQGGPDFSKMDWMKLLPRVHGDSKKNNRFIQIAKVQNLQDRAPTLTYDDKHIAVDPASSAPPPAPRVPNTAVGAPSDTDPAAEQIKAYEAAVDGAVQKIIAARASIPPRDLARDPYGTRGGNFYDPVVAGWEPKDDPKKTHQSWMTERNKQKKIDDPQGAAYQGWLSAAMPTGLDPSNADDMKKWEIFKKTIPLEGRIGTITTFDKTLTVGVGFSSSGGQAQTVIGRALNMLPALKATSFSAGLTADGKGGMQVVDTDRKWILEGQDAAAYVQTDHALLSLLVNVSQGVQPNAPGNTVDATEQGKQRQAWLDAQWQTFLAAALSGIPAEILAWPIDSIVLATHTRHAISATFPWSFWTSHNDPDLHAMVGAIYDKLRDTKQLFWLYPICGGIYKPVADAVKAKKESAAPAAAGNPGGNK